MRDNETHKAHAYIGMRLVCTADPGTIPPCSLSRDNSPHIGRCIYFAGLSRAVRRAERGHYERGLYRALRSRRELYRIGIKRPIRLLCGARREESERDRVNHPNGIFSRIENLACGLICCSGDDDDGYRCELTFQTP